MYKVDFVKTGLFMRVATERLGLGAPEMDLDGESSSKTFPRVLLHRFSHGVQVPGVNYI